MLTLIRSGFRRIPSENVDFGQPGSKLSDQQRKKSPPRCPDPRVSCLDSATMVHLDDDQARRMAKAEEIQKVLSQPVVDLWRLRELALEEGGLVNGKSCYEWIQFSLYWLTIALADRLRKQAWPKLVGIHEQCWEEETKSPAASPDSMASQQSFSFSFSLRNPLQRCITPEESHLTRTFNTTVEQSDDSESSYPPSEILTSSEHAFDVIERDVARCTWHLLDGPQRAQQELYATKSSDQRVAKHLERKQRRLLKLIKATLMATGSDETEKSDKLFYYQGFHDVASIFLSSLSASRSSTTWADGSNESVSGLDEAATVLLQIAQSHLRDCLRSDFSQLQTALQLTLMPLLAKFDRPVHDHLVAAEMEPFFATSWVITWFSRDIRDTELVKRLFDAFLVSHPLFPVYVAAAMLVEHRETILATDGDFASLHQVLRDLPQYSSNDSWRPRPSETTLDLSSPNHSILGSVGDAPTQQDRELLEQTLQDLGEGDALSHISFASSQASAQPPRVPMQEILDTAYRFMRKVPPRHVLDFASRYYGRKQVQDFLLSPQEISMLQSPPWWATMSVAMGDSVMKQNTPDSVQGKNLPVYEQNSRERTKMYLKKHVESLPVIAVGYGAGNDKARRRRRRRRRVAGGMLGSLLLITVVWYVMQMVKKEIKPEPVKLSRRRRVKVPAKPKAPVKPPNRKLVNATLPVAAKLRPPPPPSMGGPIRPLRNNPCLSNGTAIDSVLAGHQYATSLCLVSQVLTEWRANRNPNHP